MILVLKHIAIEGPGIIEEYFIQEGYSLHTVELGQGERLPESLQGIEAVVILGGPMNVYEEEKYPFLKDENVFIQTILAASLPLLGICLGAQLIAKAAGANVSRASQQEIGWYCVELNREGRRDPLFAGCGESLQVFQWHGDKFALPERAVLLAESPLANQAFRIGRNAYGLQFHLEVTPPIVCSWLDEYKGETAVDAHAIMNDMDQKFSSYASQAHRIMKNFLAIMSGGKPPPL